jgi:NAD(P)H-hydrate epimerase
LFGPSSNDFERWTLLREKAAELNVVILLKGGNTAVACPQSPQIVFNTTGNPGMGTAGTGDVLTGILTGLLAQGYTPKQTAILGAYLHGSAGDLAVAELQQESLLASDLIDHLGGAFQRLRACTN